MNIRDHINIVEQNDKVNEMARRKSQTKVKPSVVYPFDDPAGEALINKHFKFFTDADFDETDESLIGWYYRKQGTQILRHKYWAGPFPTSAAAHEAQQADPSAIKTSESSQICVRCDGEGGKAEITNVPWRTAKSLGLGYWVCPICAGRGTVPQTRER